MRSLALPVFGVLSEVVHIMSAEGSRSPVIDDIHEIEHAHTQLNNATVLRDICNNDHSEFAHASASVMINAS